jgi:hypothetical protein
MNIFIQFLLQSIAPIIEQAVASEGAAAITWLENLIESLEQKYGGTPTAPPTLTAPATPAAHLAK